MRNISLILIFFGISLIKSQSVTIDITEPGFGQPTDYYQKDLNNILNPFEGTYIYTNGSTSFKVVLKKIIKQKQGLHFEDMIVGEYQYIKNGVEKINTLSNLSISSNQLYAGHNIGGNIIISKPNHRLWKCPQCSPTEKRLETAIYDKISDRRADFFMRRVNVNGQEVIQAKIANTPTIPWTAGTTEPLDFSLPMGEFTMIKQ